MAKKDEKVPRVLLVDENAKRRQNLSSRFRVGSEKSYIIEAGLGGFHCLHMIEKQDFDLVILIDEFSDMAVAEVIGLIRGSNEVPILYMSGMDDLVLFREYFNLGANACEQLTTNFNDVLDSVNSLLP